MFRKFLLTFLAAALLLTACATTRTDGLNRTVKLHGTPQRIVSMAPSNTEILFAVGAGKQVVGRDHFSDYPAEVKSIKDIGGSMGNYDTEAIVALHPDLVTFWLGNNDVLGYATSGGVSPSAPTSSAAFGALYAQALGALRAALPNAKIVVANIPNVTCVPYFTTVGPRVAASLPAGYYLRYQKHGNTSLAFDSTRFTEATPPFITLPGQTYALLIGHPSGKWYRDNGVALPAGIDTTKPFGLHPQNPWPDALMLDADEQTVAAGAVSAFNGIIASQASVNGAAVVDINSFFTGIKANGLLVSGQEFTADYVSGGLFSLDGVHPSSRGQAVVANEFLRVINGKFGTSIPMVDVGTVPGIPSPLAKGAAGLQVDPSLYQTMQDLFGSSR